MKRHTGVISVLFRLRMWFYDTFGEPTYLRTYIGHGDFTEIEGWIFRGKFVPVYPEDLEGEQ